MNNIETKWLLDFIVLEETRSFTMASERRSISQSSLTRRIQSLETAIGFELFDRNTSPIQLTEQGRAFLTHARNWIDDVEYQVSKLSGKVNKNKINIAAAHSLSIYLMPELLHRIPSATEKVFFIESINVDEAVANLKEGKNDFILSFYNEELMSPPFLYKKILTTKLYLVSGTTPQQTARYQLHHSQTIPLLKYTDDSYMGRLINRYLETTDHNHFSTTLVSSMSDLLKRMIISGYGVGWLPDYAISEELQNQQLMIIGIDTHILNVDVYMYRTDTRLNLSSEQFWQSVKNLVWPQ